MIMKIFLPLVLFINVASAYLLHGQEIKTREMKATVLEKGETTIKVITKEGEKTLKYDNRTKGLENLKEGSKVTVEYEKAGRELRAKKVEATGSIGERCPCERCPEADYCPKKDMPVLREEEKPFSEPTKKEKPFSKLN